MMFNDLQAYIMEKQRKVKLISKYYYFLQLNYTTLTTYNPSTKKI